MGGKQARKLLDSRSKRQTSDGVDMQTATGESGRPTVRVDRTPVGGTAQRQQTAESGKSGAETMWNVEYSSENEGSVTGTFTKEGENTDVSIETHLQQLWTGIEFAGVAAEVNHETSDFEGRARMNPGFGQQNARAELEAAWKSAEQIKTKLEARLNQAKQGTEFATRLKRAYHIAKNVSGHFEVAVQKTGKGEIKREFINRLKYETGELEAFFEYYKRRGGSPTVFDEEDEDGFSTNADHLTPDGQEAIQVGIGSKMSGETGTKADVEAKLQRVEQGLELMKIVAQLKHRTDDLTATLQAEWEQLDEDERAQIKGVIESGDTTFTGTVEKLPAGWRQLLKAEYDPAESRTFGAEIENLPRGTYARAWASVVENWGEIEGSVELGLDSSELTAELEATYEAIEDLTATLGGELSETPQGQKIKARLELIYNVTEDITAELEGAYTNAFDGTETYELIGRIKGQLGESGNITVEGKTGQGPEAEDAIKVEGNLKF